MKTEKIGNIVLTKGFFETNKKFKERVAKFEVERLRKFKEKVNELRSCMPSQEKYQEWLLFSVEFFTKIRRYGSY